ncbi:adenylate/guanylate cyclase domain-containing protein [Conexibacter woesei]|uniref:Adenylate/guanylate cyclase n=1 Tax=Conexibacter woesei (strain DSM 14684 / CCUG 47730 / CIP 108061 / JCM 11494 / NBRC 100937 / ID131577) TaxID=469383 RepID=D3F969_CONWI|nr:adenylate/guanylate cyclase domain-containing protein [Conexibacter woesei]ADB49036.1 adenylate/guanylate cyclase [Conexibacter woesei DSM 14684]
MGSRHCADCGHRATDRARFCERCGTALTATAAPLRAPRTLEAKILDERTAIEGERKQVTVMYADIVGSMQLTDLLDGERWGLILDRFLAIAARAVHAFEGTVNQFTGDGLMAVFGAPLAHEDHARRACLAVLQLQSEVAELAADVAQADGVEFAIRCGLNSGEVVVGAIGDDVHMDFVPIGNTTALGKRIESLAPVGSAAISASTAALVDGEFALRELGEFVVKGAEGRQRVLELIGRGAAQTRLDAMAATRGLSPFIGRDAEGAALEMALEHALAGDGRAIGIVGDAGVGKSRLVHEFVAGCVARGLTVSVTHGVAHGRYVPLLPVLALLRDSFGVAEDDPPEAARVRIETTMLRLDPAFASDLPLLFEFLGVADPDRPAASLDPEVRQHQLLTVVTRMVASRARSEAAVLVVEDLHWLDDASAAFLEQLAEAVVGSRTLLVTTYRPEHETVMLVDGPHAQIELGPLDADATGSLLTELLGRDRSLDGLAGLIDARTGGNPFFIEEVVQALAENGHLTGARGTYELAAELEGLVLPPTVQAGLAARIDRLPAREKALVQTMSVIGIEIPGALLGAVSELSESELAEAVGVLASAQWVIPRGLRGREEYVFKHPLTQEVAYASQLSERRAHAHRAVAAAIERAYPDGLDERAALVAHHCEAAGDKLRAAEWHARAAAWAEGPSPADCMRHWRRVRALADDLDASPERDALTTKAGVGILSLSWRLGIAPEEAAAIHAEAHADIERFRGDLYYAGSLMHSGRERASLVRFRTASQAAVAAGDPGRALTASMGVAYASWVAGSLTEAVETLDHALTLAGDDPATGSGISFVCPLGHAWQSRGQVVGYMGELEQARRDFDRGTELTREHDDPQTESACHANRALLEATVGQIAAALRSAALGLAIAEPAGDTTHTIACSVPVAVADAAAGRVADALARAESDLATIREHGIGLYHEPLLLATIARSRLGLGAPDEALAAALEAVDIMNSRGLGTCALSAPITLAHVLLATQGAAAGERIETVLARAAQVARVSGAQVFQPLIQRELEALARVRGDSVGLRSRDPSP